MKRISIFFKVAIFLALFGVTYWQQTDINIAQAVGSRLRTGNFFTHTWAVGETGPVLDESAVKDLADQASPAVVSVHAYKDVPVYSTKLIRRGSKILERFVPTASKQRREVSSGSGFFVTPDGYVMTNRHVVSDIHAEYKVAISEEQSVPARVVYRDTEADLALLKIEGHGFPALTLANAAKPEIGENIVSIGNALGVITDSVATGYVSSINERIVAEGTDGSQERMNNLLEITAKLYPGDSGGPVLNTRGEVVGINVATTQGSVLSYAIPASTAQKVLSAALAW